jgi:hypothetical protein
MQKIALLIEHDYLVYFPLYIFDMLQKDIVITKWARPGIIYRVDVLLFGLKRFLVALRGNCTYIRR